MPHPPYLKKKKSSSLNILALNIWWFRLPTVRLFISSAKKRYYFHPMPKGITGLPCSWRNMTSQVGGGSQK
jgi:hypothetical protein